MKGAFWFLLLPCLFSFLILSSCQDHKDTGIDKFGELDSLQVAADTTMQVNMDRSYEFQKTLIENDTVVYDFLAYDKPKGSSSPEWESKFIIIKRTTHSHDTIVKEYRTGPVKGLTLADMDEDGDPEILFYENQTVMKYLWIVRIFKHKSGREYEEINLKSYDAKSDNGHYGSGDTFFIANDYLIRRYPYFEKQNDSVSSGDMWQSYKLSNGKLIFEKEKKVAR